MKKNKLTILFYKIKKYIDELELQVQKEIKEKKKNE